MKKLSVHLSLLCLLAFVLSPLPGGRKEETQTETPPTRTAPPPGAEELSVLPHSGGVLPPLAGAATKRGGGKAPRVAAPRVGGNVAPEPDPPQAGMAGAGGAGAGHGGPLGEAEKAEPLRGG